MSACCGNVQEKIESKSNEREEAWIDGVLSAGGKSVPRIRTELSIEDRIGGFKVRWGWKRMRYAVEPGLYGVGNPRHESPVLVTANYKLTLDALRRRLGGIDAWILVLDTKGVNVWCAAGKGTFGTAELIQRIETTGLAEIVGHRRLVLPQLGAVGVAAHEVKARTGFSVLYGPVLAKDVPAYLAAGCRKTQAMSRVPFAFYDRLVLVPIELTAAKFLYLILAAAGLLVDVLMNGRPTTASLWYIGALVGSVFAGAVLGPLLLPYIRFRAFALKGMVTGLLWSAAIVPFLPGPGVLLWGFTLVVIAISSFITMNFTGASTYTSQSGAILEVNRGLPVQGGAVILGTILIVVGAIR